MFFFFVGYLEQTLQDWIRDGEGHYLSATKFDKQEERNNQAKSNINANEDFLEVCVTAYLMVAVLDFLGMAELNSLPLATAISPDSWMEDDSIRRTKLMCIASAVVDKHVDLMTAFRTIEHDFFKV